MTPDELRKWGTRASNSSRADQDFTVLFAAADAWQLLIDAVNESDEPCPPECDSIAHAEGCPHIDRAAWMAKQQATIVDLRKRLEAAERELRKTLTDMERHPNIPIGGFTQMRAAYLAVLKEKPGA